MGRAGKVEGDVFEDRDGGGVGIRQPTDMQGMAREDLLVPPARRPVPDMVEVSRASSLEIP